MYISTPPSSEVENIQMKIYYSAGDRTPDLLNQRQTCYHLSQRGSIAQYSIPNFTDYKTLWTIRCTLIFKQLKKKYILTIFLLDCKARQKKKRFLVYETELTFKISENRHFFPVILY